ncbi:MAG TPA: bifunctional (p)ppGpp synthetase/guanosine-3',5'-bis(diphosphate) 3'-pyrophosphohydrolase, partial [Acidimicrobiia bacterium]
RPTDAARIELDTLVRLHESHHPGGDTDRIITAYELAQRKHDGQMRKSGEPFISHPVAVAEILADYGLDEATIISALLHDTIEDTDLTLADVEGTFGPEVAGMIDGVTKLERITFSSPEEAQAASIRKMVVAMAQDLRVLLIKLADRLHNLRTIAPLRQEKQERIARESLEVYAPLAHRLGVQEIKHEMEDRSFRILYPKRYAEIEVLIDKRAPERDAYLAKVIDEVRRALAEAGIAAEVTGRPKHFYSIYRKMISSGQAFDEIYDLIGIRILTQDLPACYAALGLVHSMWPPIHGRFKDYVAMPKFNLYQSLHTTVIGPDRKPLEVQIRTHDMHSRAEYGIAAHWRYKEGVGPDDLPWMADMRFLEEEHADPGEFLANLKLDLYRDDVFVLTPAGDVITLPAGSTPVDFAYAIHTDVGHRCQGAKVNGRLVSLDHHLESGDVVEILVTRAHEAGPSRDWLGFINTSRARSKIRQFFSRQRREEALGKGKQQIAERIRREGLGLSAAERDRLLAAVGEDLGYPDLDSVYVAVGEGSLSAITVATRIRRLVQPPPPEDEEIGEFAPPVARRARPTASGVIVEGLDDVWVRISRCCAPVPGDDIVGFVTVGRGVSVHRSDCTNVAALGDRQERMIEVMWAPERVGRFAVWLQVEALDRPRLLRDVTAVISDVGGNILASSSSTGRDRVAVLRYEVELGDPRQLERIVADLDTVEGVFDAYRLLPRGPLEA